jgi:heme-degrading monooxygenase HmoA
MRQIYLHVRLQVGDYIKWREGFDVHAPAREGAGATGEVYVMHDVDDANDVTVILGWSNLEQAKAFTLSASLKDAMQQAGVIGSPEFRFLEANE